jgi:hypothetical protein
MNYGGPKEEFITDLCKTNNGFLLSGFTGHKYFSDVTDSDILLIRIDSLGNEVWRKDFDTTVSRGLFAIAPAPDGGFIGVGKQGSFTYHLYIMKVDSAGNLQSQLVSNFEGEGVEVVPSASGGFIIIVNSVAPTGSDHILKFSQDLVLEWDHSVPFDLWNLEKFKSYFRNLWEDTSGNIFVSGSYESSVYYPGGWFDSSYIFIDQLNSGGSFISRHKYFKQHNTSTSGTNSHSGGGYLTELDDGNILLTGYVDSVIQLLKLSPGFAQLYNHPYNPPSGYRIFGAGDAGNNSAFVLESNYFDPNPVKSFIIDVFNYIGYLDYSLTITSASEFFVTTAVRNHNSCFVAAGYGDSTGTGQYDPISWQTCRDNTGVNEIRNDPGITIFPNPVPLHQYLRFANLPEGPWEISAYAISGIKVFEETLNNDQTISIEDHFAPGMFVISSKRQ